MIIDFIFLLIVVLFTLSGFKRGFIKEAFNLIAIFLSLYLLPIVYELIIKYIKIKIETKIMNYVVYFILFIIIYIILGLVSDGISKLINKTPLNIFNRFLGSILGLVKSAIIIFIIFTTLIISKHYYAPSKEIIKNSISIEYIAIYLSSYNNFFPKFISEKLDDYKLESKFNQFKKNILKELESGE